MSRFIEPGRFLAAEVDSDLFVLDQRTGHSFQLGGCAGRLWKLFEEGRSVEEAAAVIADATGAPLEVVKADAVAFEGKLRELSLVTHG